MMKASLEKEKEWEREVAEKYGKTTGSAPKLEEATSTEEEIRQTHFENTRAPTFEVRRHVWMVHGRPVVVLSLHI